MPYQPKKKTFDWNEAADYKVDIDKYIDKQILDCQEIIKDSTQPIKDGLFRFVIAVDFLEVFAQAKGFIKNNKDEKYFEQLKNETAQIKKENPDMDKNRLDSIVARLKFAKIMKKISDSEDRITDVEV